MMFKDFRDYLETQRPILEEAFTRQLVTVLGDIVLKDAGSLRAALNGGKKIRGCLTLLVGDALGGLLESVVPRAIAVELVQAATLIHDDFVDQDTTRRNSPAVWTIEGARRAVLIGDRAFAAAIEMMSHMGREDGLAISRAIAQVAKGALHEPLDPWQLASDLEAGRLDEQMYQKIIRLKTGILFGTACQLGAIAAEASKELRAASYQYGLRIGEAYQIADDLKEVNHHLSTRSIRPEQMVALAPPFLHFAGDMRPYVINLLRRACLDLNGRALEFFALAADLMENEIEHRVRSASAEIDERFPENGCSELLRRAPKDMISMFNES